MLARAGQTIVAAVILGLLLGALAEPSLAVPLRVTIAARQCPSFDSVTANRNRNNIMESLQNLGADTPYGRNGIPNIINPAIEAQYQPNCVPLRNWVFTFGRGYQTKAVPGVWGALSKVTRPFDTQIVTEEKVPLRDEHGHPLQGDTFIYGATTVTLDDDEADLARRGDLWIQGGTPTLPITDPDLYSFAALRCAVDNLNGDNVEFIDYPTGYEHVFCFAYYVRPAVTSGKIVVQKQLVDVPPGTGTQTFRFQGDISYNPGGFFDISASASTPGQASFDRAGGRTWSFTEQPTPGARLVGLSCTSTGTSTAETNLSTGSTTVHLVAGDTVTCTYTNSLAPPPGLLLRKVTEGAVGSFRFDVAGGGRSTSVTAVTTTPSIAAAAEPQANTQSLPPGRYTVTEHLPDTAQGTWTKSGHTCGPQAVGAPRSDVSVTIEIPAQGGLVCTFTNKFTPAGSIRLHKHTLGGFGTARFVVSPSFLSPFFRGQDVDLVQTATTTPDDNPATAKGDSTAHLPLGIYTIQETMPANSDDSGNWRVAAVLCNGVPKASTSGIITVTLTDQRPSVDCTWTNELIPPEPEPQPEPSPVPTPEPTPPSPLPPPEPTIDGGQPNLDRVLAGFAQSSAAELVVTKTATPTRVTVGRQVRYRVTVRNRGERTARRVTLVEVRSGTSRRLVLKSSQGRCRGAPPRFCALGSLKPGEQATVTVTLRTQRAGRFRNTVAVNTVSLQQTRARKIASAVIRVLPVPAPRFTG
jgi:hypothetical protein